MTSMIHPTAHAIERAIERIGCKTEAEARALLTGPAIRAAADFGAPYVKLPGGQRIVIARGVIVTVLPKDERLACLDRRIVRKAG